MAMGPGQIQAERTQGVARLKLTGRDALDVAYIRHIGVWFTIGRGLAIDAALLEIERNGLLHPTVGD